MNSALPNVPLELETKRLFLRAPYQSGDGNIVNEAIRGSFNELKDWLPFVQELPTVEESEANIKEAHINFLEKKGFRFLIFRKDTNDFIGVVSYGVNWEIPKSELGYWLNTKFGGKGYMTEAVKCLTDLGLNQIKFKRIEIRCESTNYRSRAIPERLGYELEGILKNEDLSADGKRITDTCIYAMTP